MAHIDAGKVGYLPFGLFSKKCTELCNSAGCMCFSFPSENPYGTLFQRGNMKFGAES
uniref:Uncharacterized protein n=1 Tax=Tetraselmis sp. GSL018 TaxID=582737 RepID=A0A061RSJ2_9CHLO